ncbi:MAG: hypothetical protein AAFU41_12225 [Pseudomonadota bacterium]
MQQRNQTNLYRFFLSQGAIGFALSTVFVGVLLWWDVVGLGALVANSDVGFIAVFLLWFFHGTTFGAAQFAVRLLLQSDESTSGPQAPGGRNVAVPAYARADRKRPGR